MRRQDVTNAASAHLEGSHTAVAASTEALLTSLWRQVLGFESVGPHDNFFKLGGQSLAALRLVAMISDAVGVEVGLTVLYRHPTLSEMCGWLADANAGLQRQLCSGSGSCPSIVMDLVGGRA